MKNFLKYVWCRLRGHRPQSHRMWDMVGDPRFDWWYVYRCPKCGEWK